MNVTVIVPPPFEPVSLAEVYLHLRLTPDTSGSPADPTHPDDDLLRIHIQAARQFAENAMRRSIIQQTLRLSDGAFPGGAFLCRSEWGGRNTYGQWPNYIQLPRGDVQMVNSVGYLDGDNASQPIDMASYYLTDDNPPQLRFVNGFATPSTYQRDDAVRVEYVAGFVPDGSPPVTQADYAANVPQAIKAAILIGVQLLYDNLAPADIVALERTRDALLVPYTFYSIP